MKKLFIFIIMLLIFPIVVLADDGYIVYSDFDFNGEKIITSSYSYNDENDGNDVTFYSSSDYKGNYSFKITGYNLIPDEVYTYIIKSDLKDFSQNYTGSELMDGVVISGEDGDRKFNCELRDKENKFYKTKYSDILFKKTIIKFNNDFDTSKMDEYFNSIVSDGILKVNSIDPRGDEGFIETAISSAVIKYENDLYNVFPSYDEKDLYIEISEKDDFDHRKRYPVEFEFVKTDKNVKSKVDKYAKRFNFSLDNIEKELFLMDDLETINYKYMESIYGDSLLLFNSIINYSSEFQKMMDNNNITAQLDARAGWADMFSSGGFGFLDLLYDGVIYGYAELAGVKQLNVIYVPDDTNNTREDYINAALERINKYIPDAKVKIEYEGLINDLDFNNEAIDLKDFVDVSKTLGEYYKLYINDNEYYYFIVKDSSKMKTPLVTSVDASTDISISTDSSEVPLDTKVKALYIDVNSKEYKEFLETINLNDGIVIDLKMFSGSVNKYISKIKNSKFKVYVPLTEELKNKNLVAFYVKESGEVEEHEIKIDGDYLVFETDHFSTYVIGEVETLDNVVHEENPQTYDNILNWVSLSLASVVLIGGIVLYRRKNNI